MANRLKMAVEVSIYTLLERGCSHRSIARALGIDRETVRRYAELARQDSKPAGAPPAPGPPEWGVIRGPAQPSASEPYRKGIMANLTPGQRTRRFWQSLATDGFKAKY